jgi:hypothetical protein
LQLQPKIPFRALNSLPPSSYFTKHPIIKQHPQAHFFTCFAKQPGKASAKISLQALSYNGIL